MNESDKCLLYEYNFTPTFFKVLQPCPDWGLPKPSLPASVVAQGWRICLQCREAGLFPGSGRSPGAELGYPLQYSCLGNPMDREASTVQEVVKSWTPLKWLRIAFNKLLIYLISKLDFCRAFFQTSLCNISYSSGVALSCPTLCDPMDNCLLDSSVHGIFQARVLEWVAISFSRGSSWPRDRTWVSCIVDRHFTVGATREVISY